MGFPPYPGLTWPELVRGKIHKHGVDKCADRKAHTSCLVSAVWAVISVGIYCVRLENSFHLSGPLPPHLPHEEAGADQTEVSPQCKQSSESSNTL